MIVNVESSTRVLLKAESRETCTAYPVAPNTAFHCNVSVVARLIALFAGEERLGGFGGATTVRKFQVSDHPLVPLAFFALARQ